MDFLRDSARTISTASVARTRGRHRRGATLFTAKDAPRQELVRILSDANQEVPAGSSGWRSATERAKLVAAAAATAAEEEDGAAGVRRPPAEVVGGISSRTQHVLVTIRCDAHARPRPRTSVARLQQRQRVVFIVIVARIDYK